MGFWADLFSMASYQTKRHRPNKASLPNPPEGPFSARWGVGGWGWETIAE